MLSIIMIVKKSYSWFIILISWLLILYKRMKTTCTTPNIKDRFCHIASFKNSQLQNITCARTIHVIGIGSILSALLSKLCLHTRFFIKRILLLLRITIKTNLNYRITIKTIVSSVVDSKDLVYQRITYDGQMKK